MILPIVGLIELFIKMLHPTVKSHATPIVPTTASVTDNVPLIEASTTDKLFTHKSSIQSVTTKSVTDKVPLTDPSTTDKSSIHALSIQLRITTSLTESVSITASLIENTPLTEPSTIEIFSTHNAVMQSVIDIVPTIKLSI